MAHHDDTANELAFYAEERPRLVAAGITDYDTQARELARRWSFVQNTVHRPTSDLLAADGTLCLRTELTRRDLERMGLCLVRVDERAVGGDVYVYKKIETGMTSAGAAAPASCRRKRRRGEVSALSILVKAKKYTLESLCNDLELAVSGNKDELVDRILASAD